MIEVVTGPMYSGKTEELIRRLTRAKIAGKRVIAYKPKIDDRYGSEVLASHSGIKIVCKPIELAQSIMDNLDFYDVVGIDEAQFFDFHLLSSIQVLERRDIQVIVAGLDMTYRREPFGCMPYLMAIAQKVIKLSAVCHQCGADAMYTQRLIDGKPASFSGSTILVGAKDSYEARCFYCYEEGYDTFKQYFLSGKVRNSAL